MPALNPPPPVCHCLQPAVVLRVLRVLLCKQYFIRADCSRCTFRVSEKNRLSERTEQPARQPGQKLSRNQKRRVARVCGTFLSLLAARLRVYIRPLAATKRKKILRSTKYLAYKTLTLFAYSFSAVTQQPSDGTPHGGFHDAFAGLLAAKRRCPP